MCTTFYYTRLEHEKTRYSKCMQSACGVAIVGV